MRHTLCTIIIISYYSSFFVSGWFYGHLNEVSDDEATALIALHYDYTWWNAVVQCVCDKPLGRRGWNLKPQLLASHWALARPTDLSTHLYLNNLYAFCLTEPQNHQRERQKEKKTHPSDLLHILLAKKDTWKLENIKHNGSFVLCPGRIALASCAYFYMFTCYRWSVITCQDMLLSAFASLCIGWWDSAR